MTRRAVLTALLLASVLAVSGILPSAGVRAQDKTLYVGIAGAYTGADAFNSIAVRNGALMAFREANDQGGVAGYKIEAISLDNATATAGQYDLAHAATNARKFVTDPRIVALIGPDHSGEGKAISAILSEGDLATISPDTTSPDITAPQFAAQYRPRGKAVYFRTLTPDNYRGPQLANFFAEKLGVKSVYVLDDSGSYGVGLADAFTAGARAKGLTVLGRDSLNPKEAD